MGEVVDGTSGDCRHDVEVEAAEIRAQPPALVQAVGIGDVGVEDWPDEIDPYAHHAGLRASIARSGGVPELMEGQSADHQATEEQQLVRVDKNLASRFE